MAEHKGQVRLLLDLSLTPDSEDGDVQKALQDSVREKLPDYLVKNSGGLITAVAVESVGEFSVQGPASPLPSDSKTA